MKGKNATANLQETIALLKLRQELELQELKQQFHLTRESLKPANLIKTGIKNATATPGIKSTLVKAGLGLATAYFSKKVLFRAAQKPVKKILGSLIGMGIARFAVKKITKEKEPAAANNK